MYNKLFTIALLGAVFVDAKKDKKDANVDVVPTSGVDSEFLQWAA